MIEWFEEYAEEFFQTHTDLGDSLYIAETLADELLQFENSTRVSLSVQAYAYSNVFALFTVRSVYCLVASCH